MSGSGGSSSKNIQQHLSEIETKAYANARIRCSELFSQPESLNEIETIKRKVKQERDKNDKKLKQSIQSQLEGVSLALNKLQNISHQSSLLSKDNEVLYSSLKQILAMSKQLKGLRETNKVHQQLKSIIQNFEYIFNMNDLIKKGFLYLNNERPNFLGAHDIYMKLNGARDTLLLEVHKQSSDQNSQPNSIISNYFAPTNDLFNGIESKIHTVLKTLTNIVKDDPKIIVSCFRIIEREEKLDEYAAGLQKRFNFMPPHRPRNMRIKAFEKIEACLHYSVSSIIETESNDFGKVSRALLRFMKDELICVKLALKDVIPRDYKIIDWYFEKIHAIFSKFFVKKEENITTDDVLVILMTLKDYYSEEYFKNKIFEDRIDKLPPLIPEAMKNSLMEKFSFDTIKSLSQIMTNGLNQDANSWLIEEDLLTGVNNAYCTRLELLITNCIEAKALETVNVMPELNSMFALRVLDTLNNFVDFYWTAISDYYNFSKPDSIDDDDALNHLKLKFLIANANNGIYISQRVHNILSPYVNQSNQDKFLHQHHILEKKFNVLVQNISLLYSKSICDQLKDHMSAFFTPSWSNDHSFMEVVLTSFFEYAEEFEHFEESIKHIMLEAIYSTIIQMYLSKFLKSKEKIKLAGSRNSFSLKATQEITNAIDLSSLDANGHERVSDYLKIFTHYMNIFGISDLTVLYYEIQDTKRDLELFPRSFLDIVLHKRSDLRNEQIEEILSGIKFGNKYKYFVDNVMEMMKN